MSFLKKLDQTAFIICATLFILLPFHAFFFTWFKSFFWTDSWTIIIQSWKEILVGVLGILALGKLISVKKFPHSRAFWLGVGLVILAISYLLFDGIWMQKILGLRTATLFLIAFLSIQFFEFEKVKIEQLKRIVLLSGSVVIFFALAQKFLLPVDFLKHFGYSENVSSWLPGGNLPIYHLVGDSGMIRLQSTFAGPNQLGAYLLVILPLAIAELWRNRKKENWWRYFLVAEILGGILVLSLTFSRSAWLGASAIFLLFAIYQWKQNLPQKLKAKLLFGGILAIVALGIFGFSNEGLREIITREASTSAHFERTATAAQLVVENPLGLGLGKTAGVSQRFENPLTPENTYLGIALELGWLGGILFLAFLTSLALELKKADSELFYSLVGIAVIALFLHPLEDAPTTLTLFLLAGVVNSPK